MPRLWTDTLDAHKKAVREAIFTAVADLVAEGGPAAVTMSGVAGRSGIGRATLYKYFPDIEALLVAWHERVITAHLDHVEQALRPTADNVQLGTAASAMAGHATGPDGLAALRSALQAYAHLIAHSDPVLGGEIAARLHRTDHVRSAEQRLVELLAERLRHSQGLGGVRDDVPPAELAVYCLSAMSAARRLSEPAALDRLLDLVIVALQPTSPPRGDPGTVNSG
ncbi:TetR/AcrR family transcriptional regulator [Pseudonocardia halophobica]|uniref:TetR/AcrR family transcriptional regulator n=1 Tax=Pseudonocardia halophobica TaxID=29401 RepID=UPI003D8A4E11